jgi:hypothetical protein
VLVMTNEFSFNTLKAILRRRANPLTAPLPATASRQKTRAAFPVQIFASDVSETSIERTNLTSSGIFAGTEAAVK